MGSQRGDIKCHLVSSKRLLPCVLAVEGATFSVFVPADGEGDDPRSKGMANGHRPEKPALQVNSDDVIGVSEPKLYGESEAAAMAIEVIYYPRKKKSLVNRDTRKKVTIMLVFNSSTSLEENKLLAMQMRNHLLNLINKEQAGGDFKRFSKALLILINPKAGAGKAERIFAEKIEPMLVDAGVNMQTPIVTEKAGQATELMKTLDLDSYYGVMCISGDGLLFEVYQGLLARTDWQRAVQLPIAPAPCGSGNALCCSLNYYAGEEVAEGPHISTYVTLKHTVQPMDLVAVDTLDGRLYSFLSVTWGMVADIDIESEKYRYLGAARFTVAAMKKIASAKAYYGKVSFLPAGEYKPYQKPHQRASSRDRSLSEEGGPAGHTDAVTASPKVRSISVDAVTRGVGTVTVEDQGDVNHKQIPSTSLNGGRECEGSETVGDEQDGGKEVFGDEGSQTGSTTQPGPSTPLLNPLTEPPPEDWVTIEGSFVSVLAVTQSHISHDVMASPHSHLSDGAIHITIIHDGITRMQLFRGLLAMETGEHLNRPWTQYIKAKAFRFEPVTPGGHIVVDGELARYGAVQGQILPAVARVMGKPKST